MLKVALNSKGNFIKVIQAVQLVTDVSIPMPIKRHEEEEESSHFSEEG